MTRDRLRTIPLYNLRLEDLRRWHIVEARCGKCGRVEPISLAYLQANEAPFVRLVTMLPRLRCRSCGNGAGNTLAVRMMERG